ncbi:unnamed protein product [Periconia digitata]|uniref:Uncharacterized protein n=1 Tax=Periconia digitata TaxID=1303443 RepID=A0A9W4U7C3_9PLEO|nr:unnamed protein product [Periconia digitata]
MSSTPPVARGKAVQNTLYHLDRILDRITEITTDIAILHDKAEKAILKADREKTTAELKALVEKLDEHYEEHQASVRSIDINDMIAFYRVAGRTEEQARKEVEDDFNGVKAMVDEMRRCAKEALADVVYEEIGTPLTESEISFSKI